MTFGGAELGQELRERRRSAGLTRTRLADRTGFDAADLARWERGEASPDPDEVVALAEAIGLDAAAAQAWLDAVATVDLTESEASIEISPPDLIPGERPSVPPPLHVAPAATPRRPTPPERSGLIRRPGRGALSSVFPDVRYADYDPAVRIYSTDPTTYPSADDEAFYRLRRLRTAGVLLALAIALWWAVGSLGEGWSDVLDLFRTPSEVPPLTGA